VYFHQAGMAQNRYVMADCRRAQGEEALQRVAIDGFTPSHLRHHLPTRGMGEGLHHCYDRFVGIRRDWQERLVDGVECISCHSCD